MKIYWIIITINFALVLGVSILENEEKGVNNKNGFSNCSMQGNPETLKSVQIIIRHGARSPIYDYSKDPYIKFDYGVESGQLIPKGKYHSFLLGKCIRQRYDDLLGKTYNTKKLFCQSSQRDRTMVTASLVMAGIFPPSKDDPNSEFSEPNLNWQPIPCVTINSVIDNKIAHGVFCPALDTATDDFKDNSPESIQLQAKYRQLYILLTNLTGQPIKDYDDVYHLYDTIKIQHEEFQLDYPFWFEHLKSEMKEHNDFSFYASSPTRLLQKLLTGPLMNEMVNNFNGIIGEPNEGNRKVDLYLYSGHDSTVTPVLQTLGIYDRDDPPNFNAAIFIELHESEGKYFIKVFYQNGFYQNMIEKYIPGCDKPCSFETFKELLDDVVISDKNWRQLCGNNDQNYLII